MCGRPHASDNVEWRSRTAQRRAWAGKGSVWKDVPVMAKQNMTTWIIRGNAPAYRVFIFVLFNRKLRPFCLYNITNNVFIICCTFVYTKEVHLSMCVFVCGCVGGFIRIFNAFACVWKFTENRSIWLFVWIVDACVLSCWNYMSLHYNIVVRVCMSGIYCRMWVCALLIVSVLRLHF